jgi:hypothetical protein
MCFKRLNLYGKTINEYKLIIIQFDDILQLGCFLQEALLLLRTVIFIPLWHCMMIVIYTDYFNSENNHFCT